MASLFSAVWLFPFRQNAWCLQNFLFSSLCLRLVQSTIQHTYPTVGYHIKCERSIYMASHCSHTMHYKSVHCVLSRFCTMPWYVKIFILLSKCTVCTYCALFCFTITVTLNFIQNSMPNAEKRVKSTTVL